LKGLIPGSLLVLFIPKMGPVLGFFKIKLVRGAIPILIPTSKI
jgi:hypothetical protein